MMDGKGTKRRSGESTRSAGYPAERTRILSGEPISEFWQPVPRDVASRNAKEVCDEGRGVGPHGQACSTWTSRRPFRGSASTTVREKYGNLFDIYACASPERTRVHCVP